MKAGESIVRELTAGAAGVLHPSPQKHPQQGRSLQIINQRYTEYLQKRHTTLRSESKYVQYA